MLNKYLYSLTSFAAGAGFCLALMLSCGDNSPSDADASCNCAPAEAPLAGRTIEVERAGTLPLPPANMSPLFGKGGASVDCPAGSILLSGGCAASLGAVPDIVVEASFPALTSWSCRFKNLSNDPVPVRAIAKCLMPAQ
jgi:hypothetical protein